MATIEQRFGRRLHRVREAAGDSVEAVASACGVDRTNIWRWERGEGGPRARQLLKLLRHYRKQADYLVNGDPGEEEAAVNDVLAEFLKTPIGQAIEAERLTSVLSSIQFKDTPSILQYRKIALVLLGGTVDDS